MTLDQEYNIIVDYMKGKTKDCKQLGIHYYPKEKPICKEVYFKGNLTSFLQQNKMWDFNKTRFNIWCKIRKNNLEYKGNGRFEFRNEKGLPEDI